MIAVSKYGSIGISQEIEAKDAKIYCAGALMYNTVKVLRNNDSQ